jgi:hypothetical protein
MNSAFDSLDDAVRSSFPENHCRLLAVREHGDFAVALFDTRPTAAPYLYEVHYERRDGRWSESSSGNGSGRCSLRQESDLGVLTSWGEAPAGADKVRAELAGQVAEESVTNGIYLFAWWDVPSESLAEVTAFRINGQWMPTTRWEFRH